VELDLNEVLDNLSSSHGPDGSLQRIADALERIADFLGEIRDKVGNDGR